MPSPSPSCVATRFLQAFQYKWVDGRVPGRKTHRPGVYLSGGDTYSWESPEGVVLNVYPAHFDGEWDDPKSMHPGWVGAVMWGEEEHRKGVDKKFYGSEYDAVAKAKAWCEQYYENLKDKGFVLEFSPEAYKVEVVTNIKRIDARTTGYESGPPDPVHLGLQFVLYRQRYAGDRNPSRLKSFGGIDLTAEKALEALVAKVEDLNLDPTMIIIRNPEVGARTVVGPYGLAQMIKKMRGEAVEKPQFSSDERVGILETLLSKVKGTPVEGQVQAALLQLQGGESLSDDTLKGLRHKLYQNGMRTQADKFR